jgi:hypothetical protein
VTDRIPYVTMDKKFYKFIFKQKVAAAPVTFTFTFLITFLEKTFLRKIIIILCDNYIIIIFINNNEIIK